MWRVPEQAQEQLFHARRILGYSYAFAFWMFDGDLYAAEISPDQNVRNQNLFEDQQQQLESQVGAVPRPSANAPLMRMHPGFRADRYCAHPSSSHVSLAWQWLVPLGPLGGLVALSLATRPWLASCTCCGAATEESSCA